MKIWISLALILFSTYAQAKDLQPSTPFDAVQHFLYAGDGTARLDGGVAINDENGAIRTCGAEPVILIPMTGYGMEFAAMLVTKSDNDSITGDHDFLMLIRRSRCDVSGNFAFTRLPPGNWIVVARVSGAKMWATRSYLSTNMGDEHVVLGNEDLSR
ncbi:hypothetical protein AZA_84219 [Nitrospirillum viridazoti Y2]|uniref:hypothetical protein n=1 Tax=Nitrospirillum viridazoti TaxID=3144925 RepID=UPI0002265B0D|nr:hypothetical protein [Nitrospirillum amazonense]EGY00833.1 hypothetical protein AZA_84219 [Nitrospirillum amazonense Y2]